jgi:acyl-ACP thioesterase
MPRVPVDSSADDELAPIAGEGRVYAEEIRVGPNDVNPKDRAKLHIIAGWLQDVAYRDVVEVGTEDAGFWIVRRTRIHVERFPRFAEDLTARTSCTGASHALAQRRTSIHGKAGAAIEAVSVWVNVDPETQTPARLSERFFEVYAPRGPKPRSKLRHPAPPAEAQAEAWTFRPGDLDVVGHVNNTRYWAVADEFLVDPAPSTPVDIEIEHRSAAPAGAATVAHAGNMLWISAPEGGEVYASACRAG